MYLIVCLESCNQIVTGLYEIDIIRLSQSYKNIICNNISSVAYSANNLVTCLFQFQFHGYYKVATCMHVTR